MITRAGSRRAAVVLSAALLVGSLAGTSLAADPASEKESVAGAVEAAADTGMGRVDRIITSAATAIRQGLAADLWIDAATPASVETFRFDVAAARKLSRAVRRAPATGSTLRPLIERLASIDRALASSRIDEAAGSASPRVMARAERLLARGDAALAKARYPSAIRSYARAWKMATRALGDAPPGDGGAAAVALAVNYRASYSAWTSGDNPPGDLVFDDEVIDLQYVVANAGTVDLTSVAITDSVFAGEVAAACAPPTLGPGDSYECVVSGLRLPAGQHENVGTVTAVGGGESVSASNPVYLTVREVGG